MTFAFTDIQVDAAGREIFPHTDLSIEQSGVLARIALKEADILAWQPIETAPHDTRLVLGWWRNDGSWAERIDRASWDWSICNGARFGRSRHHAATHWRALSTPPGGE